MSEIWRRVEWEHDRKKALRERIESLSEEEAAELLAKIDWDSTEYEELTQEDDANAPTQRDE